MSIEAFAVGVAVVFVLAFFWAWFNDMKPDTKPEISDMTEAELTAAMKRLGDRYSAMADVIRERRFQDEIVRTLSEDEGHEPGCPALGGYGTSDTSCICQPTLGETTD